MNLLSDAWIPIQNSGVMEKIKLQELLCGEKGGELCLPRDDMEFACLQLLVAITQVLFTPEDKKELISRIKQPLTAEEYLGGCEGKLNWFDLEHPETPFMQFRGVKAKEPTPMNKLMAGVADGTNKAFVNPDGLAEGLCASCVAIALYNVAYNCPSMGGGFKSGMRGSTPITVIISGSNLRQTLWHNILANDTLNNEMTWHSSSMNQVPNYVDGLAKDSKFDASTIGLSRGLLWQPARFELCKPEDRGRCSSCGKQGLVYKGFNKEKLNYTITGVWPHPLSSRTFSIKKGEREEKFPSFTTTQPTWVHLAKLLADIKRDKEGYHPAPVINQIRSFGAGRLDFYVAGYRNNQATVLERRHELFSLAENWGGNSAVIDELIRNALTYKDALYLALTNFCGTAIMSAASKRNRDRIREIAGQTSAIFYQQTESIIHNVLARIDFSDPFRDLSECYAKLKVVVIDLFDQATSPYQQEPKMLKALASSRRLLHKYLKELELHGGDNE